MGSSLSAERGQPFVLDSLTLLQLYHQDLLEEEEPHKYNRESIRLPRVSSTSVNVSSSILTKRKPSFAVCCFEKSDCELSTDTSTLPKEKDPPNPKEKGSDLETDRHSKKDCC